MTNNRVGVSKMPNHRSIIELASRANSSLDDTIQKFHLAIATEFADVILEPEEFVKRWYNIAVNKLDDDQLVDMSTRFITYARIFFETRNPYFARRLADEYAKYLRSNELPVKPWKPVTEFKVEEPKESYTVQELRDARAEFRKSVEPGSEETRSIFFDRKVELEVIDGTRAVEIKDVESTPAEAPAEAVLEEPTIEAKPARVLPEDFEDMKINDLRTLAKEWDIPTADLRSKEDYRAAIRAAVDS